MFLSVGLMSGTSADGIDAALLETDGESSIRFIGHKTLDYSPKFHYLLKAAEYLVRLHDGNLNSAFSDDFMARTVEFLSQKLGMPLHEAQNEMTNLTSYLNTTTFTLKDVIHHTTFLHGQIVQNLLSEYEFNNKQIDVVGYHGQTLYHRPSSKSNSVGVTIQVGDGQQLAEQLGITVVNNFRARDVEAGGEGAPLAPLYHQALAVRHHNFPVAVVNCGGIANISAIYGESYSQLYAFDTGPGNGLIDLIVKRHTQTMEMMDIDGRYGLKGKVQEDLLQKLYKKSIKNETFFDDKPPKSLDIGDMVLIPEVYEVPFEDACATLEAFTADSIVYSINHLPSPKPMFWVLAGGGWKNPVIRRELENRLKVKLGNDVTIRESDELGWHNKSLEAQIFGYLAVRTIKSLAISVPQTTRVPYPMKGGDIHVPTQGATANVVNNLNLSSSSE